MAQTTSFIISGGGIGGIAAALVLAFNDVRTGEKVIRVALGDMARVTYGFPHA